MRRNVVSDPALLVNAYERIKIRTAAGYPTAVAGEKINFNLRILICRRVACNVDRNFVWVCRCILEPLGEKLYTDCVNT